MEDFKQVREDLIDMLEDLDERLEKITHDVKQLDKKVINLPEQQNIGIGKNGCQDSLDQPSQLEMEKIKQAISRIDSGVYGICLQCGQPISKDHLKTISYSSLCTHCMEKDN